MSPVVRAALWMTGAIVSFSSMAVAGREIADGLDTFEIMLYRSLIGIVIVTALAWQFGTLGQITTRHMRYQFARNLVHFAGQNLWYFSITVIPLAQVFALEFTSPIWVVLLAPIVLGERLTSVRIMAASIGFAGILIVTRPSPETLSLGIFTAAGAAVFFAMTSLFTKRLTRSETVTCIMFWLVIMQAVFGLITAGYDGDIALPTTAALPWLMVIGIGGLVAHFCITTALSLAPAAVVVPFDFIRLPVIAVVGMALYEEPLDWFVLLGAAVIFGANYLNIWTETRRSGNQTA
ncbi:DMT family transporter [Rhodalgimonas zhirmunskyi]|uniref:DMT family transporter n=1 Tax=Rhodalgimonas zhirmunskyi TaxID=2964767 RepID=A0AAJ1U4I8_9RHOB|nr:DMT family transporter [Rhodoalgimonas zhirmunskyi]MDQ2092849.1 DMT family transporter [Rhodoalgimonas zhirmunskyi]